MEPIKNYRVFLVAIAANLSVFAVGNSIAWSSPVMPRLVSKKGSPLSRKIDRLEESLISSLFPLGGVVAPFAAGALTGKYGPKSVALLSSIFPIYAYIIMAIADEVWLILFGRLLQGFGAGFIVTLMPIYLGEIASDKVRGTVGAMFDLFLVSGVLYVYIIGPFVSYKTLQYFCLAIPILFVLVFIMMPSSPYAFVGFGEIEKAVRALKFLRGQSENGIQGELAKIQTIVDTAKANEGTILDVFRRGSRKALLICLGLQVFQIFSGIEAVLFNAESIFRSANVSLEPSICSIVVGVAQVIAAGLTPLFADRIGRKIILCTSACVMCIGLTALGTFFYFKDEVGDASKLNWLPLPSLLLFIFAFNTGFGPIPWAILGELFQLNVKGFAVALCVSLNWFLSFITTFFYPEIAKTIGPCYAFWIFAFCCIIAFLFVSFVVMETRGMSFRTIQRRLDEPRT